MSDCNCIPEFFKSELSLLIKAEIYRREHSYDAYGKCIARRLAEHVKRPMCTSKTGVTFNSTPYQEASQYCEKLLGPNAHGLRTEAASADLELYKEMKGWLERW